MAGATVDETRLKELFKEALVELIEERKDFFQDLIVEAIEDVALVRAIEEGENTPTAPRDEVFEVLEKTS
jgi:ribosomal protein L12E/L44/L45/RPP1/RPP2